ncbi:hypothetical protein FPOAC1_007543 [Fusarium poae]|uniref:hypothetical protein n=1 Tax=Fusarium poae TaxID=36050 RepID=UPI001CE88C39|nr:hypothetical protein FPOAC1_007543 [Fusarium poae]KAG8668167.1 hypothetical protein FPOAC1_007543 [Fusarium poae]
MEEVEFDADIAGIGVLIAFVATSLAVIIVLVFAFSTLSVPLRLLNTGDIVMAARMRRLYRRLRSWLPKLKRAKEEDNRNERVAAYKAFLLSTSDQLLVSQVAILIAAFIIYSEITIYSVNIVVALGCLASTVHLGCFPFYLDRLEDHSAAKFFRVLAMIAGSGMLIFMLIVQLSYSWDMETHVYFTCAMQDFDIDGNTFANRFIDLFVPLTVLYGTYEIVKLLYTQQPRDIESTNRHTEAQKGISPPPRINHVAHIMTGIFIEMHPICRIPERLQRCIDTNSTDQLSTIEKEALYIYIRLQRNSTDNSENIYRQLQLELLDQNPKTPTLRDIWQRVDENQRNTLVNNWLQMKALALLSPETGIQPHLKLRSVLAAERWAFHQCRGSFVWRIFWLWSGNVYGTATIFASRVTRIVMIVLLASLTLRRVTDLIFMAKVTKSMPEILYRLGSDNLNEPSQVGDQASRMVMAQGAVETNQDVQEEYID